MKRVIIESPHDSDDPEVVAENERYLRACMHDCLLRGEAPYASHGLYTQPGVLDDNNPVERTLGINAGFAWRSAANYTVVYTDRGISTGMKYGIAHAVELGHKIERRMLGDW